jgi:hypothetical protein
VIAAGQASLAVHDLSRSLVGGLRCPAPAGHPQAGQVLPLLAVAHEHAPNVNALELVGWRGGIPDMLNCVSNCDGMSTAPNLQDVLALQMLRVLLTATVPSSHKPSYLLPCACRWCWMLSEVCRLPAWASSQWIGHVEVCCLLVPWPPPWMSSWWSSGGTTHWW